MCSFEFQYANIGNVAIIMTDASSLPAEMHSSAEDTTNSQPVPACVCVCAGSWWWMLLEIITKFITVHEAKAKSCAFPAFHFRFSWNENCFNVHRCVCVCGAAALLRRHKLTKINRLEKFLINFERKFGRHMASRASI